MKKIALIMLSTFSLECFAMMRIPSRKKTIHIENGVIRFWEDHKMVWIHKIDFSPGGENVCCIRRKTQAASQRGLYASEDRYEGEINPDSPIDEIRLSVDAARAKFEELLAEIKQAIAQGAVVTDL